MIGLREVVLGLLLHLPPWYGDATAETPVQRQDRIGVIAQAIDDASLRAVCGEDWAGSDLCTPVWFGERVDLAMLLVTLGWWESRFARYVHAGAPGAGGALTPWQLEHGEHLPWQRWRALPGLKVVPTTEAAWEASRAISLGMGHCGTVRGAISLYATGQSCSWSGADRRLRTYVHLRSRAEQLRHAARVRHLPSPGHGPAKARRRGGG